jgi:hypothetical protein
MQISAQASQVARADIGRASPGSGVEIFDPIGAVIGISRSTAPS